MQEIALARPRMTLTEQTLARIWREAETSGDWLECNASMRRIASILIEQGCNNSAAKLFMGAAEFALTRLAYDIQHREAA